MELLGPLRHRLLKTFAGQSEGVPPWEDALENGVDTGYFPADSAVWEVHGSRTAVAAGIRALLIQALHPGALAGVVEHSDYQSDPLARLAGTIRWIFTVTYGDTVAAQEACRYVRKIHVPVRGAYTDGHGEEQRYSANDPGLAEWVHLAFEDAFLRSYEIFRGPVPPRLGGADAYVEEWAQAGEMMGVQNPPRSDAQLKAKMEQYDADGLLAGGPRVAEVVSFLRAPPLDPVLMPGYRLLFAAVVDGLPARYRQLLGLQAPGIELPGSQRLGLPARFGGKLTLSVIGSALPKKVPSELAALRRKARLGQPGDLSYADYGLTELGHAPAGYRTVRRRVRVGTGEEAFRRLADGILDWDMHRGAGLAVPPSTPRATPGVRVVSGMGIGPMRLPAPCRVLWAEDQQGAAMNPGSVAQRSGFGYGTLKGHPVAGEEAFTAVLEDDGSVWFEVLAYSRPANWLMRAAAPVTERTQEWVTRAYFRSAERLATGNQTKGVG